MLAEEFRFSTLCVVTEPWQFVHDDRQPLISPPVRDIVTRPWHFVTVDQHPVFPLQSVTLPDRDTSWLLINIPSFPSSPWHQQTVTLSDCWSLHLMIAITDPWCFCTVDPHLVTLIHVFVVHQRCYHYGGEAERHAQVQHQQLRSDVGHQLEEVVDRQRLSYRSATVWHVSTNITVTELAWREAKGTDNVAWMC